MNLSPYFGILFNFCYKKKWEKTVKLCRFVNENTLWACLAAVSLNLNELETAEISLAACELIEKVQYINEISEIPNLAIKNAAMALYLNKICNVIIITLRGS